jgi:penicillin amidase
MEIKRSRNGIVVSGMHPLLSGDSTMVCMRWTGHEPSDETRAYLKLMQAENWQDFTEAIRHFRVPAQNFVFASRAGDIGYYLGGSVPIRDGTTGILPHEGWQKQGQWSAYVDYEELPHSINPKQGYIATANNKIVDESYPYYLSNQWEPDSRIVRIHELLTSKDKFSLADFAVFQQDITSAYTNKLLPEIIADLENTPASDLSQEMKIMAALLKDWDGTESTQLLQPTLFHAFLVKIAENTFSDEMGDELYQQYIALGNVPTRVIAKLLTAENSPWFDDAQTETIETKHDIVLKSLHDARQLLIDLAGEDEGNWLWGDVHTLNMKHPLAVMRPLEILL